METVLALDVGGTKLAAGVVDEAGGVLARAARPTPAGDDAEAVLAALLDAAAEVRRGDEQACGVGCGGPMAAGGATVSPLNIAAWRDFPLRSRLAAALDLPVHVDNDAKALALAEGWRGAAVGVADYLAMVVSTGVGGGIVLDGRLLDGASGNAGHIGHVIVEPEGRPCVCGARGCLEAEASGTAIAARTGAPGSRGDGRRARAAPAASWVGPSASVASLLDLRLAVVAGSVALGYGEAFFGAAQAELDRSARISFARGRAGRPRGPRRRRAPRRRRPPSRGGRSAEGPDGEVAAVAPAGAGGRGPAPVAVGRRRAPGPRAGPARLVAATRPSCRCPTPPTCASGWRPPTAVRASACRSPQICVAYLRWCRALRRR